MRRLFALAVVSALFLVGCGGGSDEDVDPLAGGPPDTQQHGGHGAHAGEASHGGDADHADHAGNPTSVCEPSGTTLSITASGTKFDKDCLAAPANQAFTINYDNKDQLAHNIVILQSHSATDAMFKADLFRGPATKTFDVPALTSGTYAFHSDSNPAQMSGTFIVK
jgi:plastocyanin